jgi:hypothetical protein
VPKSQGWGGRWGKGEEEGAAPPSETQRDVLQPRLHGDAEEGERALWTSFPTCRTLGTSVPLTCRPSPGSHLPGLGPRGRRGRGPGRRVDLRLPGPRGAQGTTTTMSRDAEGVARGLVARVPRLWGARGFSLARGSCCPRFGVPVCRSSGLGRLAPQAWVSLCLEVCGCSKQILGGPGWIGRCVPAAACEDGGHRSAAGGFGRRRCEQPGPAGSCPGLARAEAAAPAEAPAPPGTRAPAPVPARAALHRGLAAPPPAGAYLPARRSALRLARRRTRLCPPRRVRAPRTRTPAAPSRQAPRAWTSPPPREPHDAPPAFRPRGVLRPAGHWHKLLFLGQSPGGGQNEVREGSGESQRVTWSSCLVPEGLDCPRLFQPVLVGRSLDLFQRRKINPSSPIQNALAHSTTGPSVHPPVCPFILPPIHSISRGPHKTTRLLRDLGSVGPCRVQAELSSSAVGRPRSKFKEKLGLKVYSRTEEGGGGFLAEAAAVQSHPGVKSFVH